MSPMEQELFYFNEIKNKYKPIKNRHLVLDLDAYKLGQEIIKSFEIGSEEYFQLINVERYEKKLEQVIITSNRYNSICFHSKLLIVEYNYDTNEIEHFEDLTPDPYKLNRSMKQEIELLLFELNNPKPRKPAC